MSTDPATFIDKIWSLQVPSTARRRGFVSTKDWESGDWEDYCLAPPNVEVPGTRDLYFAPCLFTGTRRIAEKALPSRWLYADLDEVDPNGIIDVPPTVSWETSPGRYQALWLLDRPLTLERFESLNKRLTYHVGADKGGWSATKVLRVPGSISTKYGKSRAKRFEVHIVGKGSKYTVQELQQLVPRLESRKPRKGIWFPNAEEMPDRKEVLDEWRTKLPIRARKLLSTKTVVRGDDRSARLWELYNLLLQSGMSPAEVLVSVQGSVWNKYAGQRREIRQLTDEISKAAEKHADATELERLKTQRERQGKVKLKGAVARKLEKRKEENPNTLPYLTNSEFLQQQFPEPEWLVEGIWSKNAYGIWAGEYKAYKTVTLLDFAVSVASGVPFLDRFNVRSPGGVLYLHEEGQRGLIRDRLHRIEYNKGLAAEVRQKRTGEVILEAPTNLDHLHISSFPGFKLTNEDSQRQLINYVEQNKPRAVILETWYLIAGEIDENKATEVAPVLDFLSAVSRDYEFALILSHHYNKGNDSPDGKSKKRAPDRLSGSGVFGRWFESGVFIERVGEEDSYTARLEAQHREQKGSGRLELQFEMDVEDENNYNVTLIDKEQTTLRVHDAEQVVVDLDHPASKRTRKSVGL